MAAPSEAFEAGRAAGQIFGSAALTVGLAFGTYKLLTSRDPDVNPKGSWALALAFAMWIFASWLGTVGKGASVAPIVGGLIILIVGVASLVLAVVALVERPSSPRPKRAQPIAAMFLSGVLLMVFVGGFVYAVWNKSRVPPELAADNAKSPGHKVEHREFNYSFTMPPKPWVQLDAKKLNRLASTAVMRTGPTVMSIVIAENINSDATSDTLSAVARSNLEKVATETNFRWEKPRTVHGLDGVAQRIDATVNTQKFTYVYWSLAYDKRLYQLVTWGSVDDAATIELEAEKLAEHFDVIKRAPKKQPDDDGDDD